MISTQNTCHVTSDTGTRLVKFCLTSQFVKYCMTYEDHKGVVMAKSWSYSGSSTLVWLFPEWTGYIDQLSNE